MNKEPSRSSGQRLRFIECREEAIAAHYDLELNAEFAYLTGRYLTSLPLAPVEASPSVRHVMLLRWLEEGGAGAGTALAQKLLDVVNNKYDLLIRHARQTGRGGHSQ